jgi:hypothetical protein
MRLLHALCGVEGVAALIHQAVAMDMEGGVPGALPPHTPAAVPATTLSDGMARDTEAARRRIFGRNDTTQQRTRACVACVFLRLLLRCLTDDVVLLFAGGVVESALGLVQCAPIYIEVPEGDVHLTRCPLKPFWVRHQVSMCSVQLTTTNEHVFSSANYC